MFIACFLKDLQNIPKQSSPLYTSNVHILDTEQPHRTFSPTYAVNNFSELYLHLAILSVKDLI